MSSRYNINDAKKNKDLIGDIVEVEKVRSNNKYKKVNGLKRPSIRELIMNIDKRMSSLEEKHNDLKEIVVNIDNKMVKIENKLNRVIKLNKLKI